uniref:Uncharacterized protein n=1 Tax=Arundo donax TaxID=35708 RepID=A0A0A8ZED2_ARUDO
MLFQPEGGDISSGQFGWCRILSSLRPPQLM